MGLPKSKNKAQAGERKAKRSLKRYSWKDDLEDMFVDYHRRRRVYVHPVPAPWSRVVLISLVYALLISVVKFAWFQTFGKPQWIVVKSSQLESTLEQNTPNKRR